MGSSLGEENRMRGEGSCNELKTAPLLGRRTDIIRIGKLIPLAIL